MASLLSRHRVALDADPHREDRCQIRHDVGAHEDHVSERLYVVCDDRWVHASNLSVDHAFTTRSMVTPVSTALSAP